MTVSLERTFGTDAVRSVSVPKSRVTRSWTVPLRFGPAPRPQPASTAQAIRAIARFT
jgi:hypothetical protein